MDFANETYSSLSCPMRHSRKSLCLGGPNGDIVLLELRPKGGAITIGGSKFDRSKFDHSQINSGFAQARKFVLYKLLLLWPNYVQIMRKTRYAKIYLIDALCRSSTPVGPFRLTQVGFSVTRSLTTGT